MEGARLAALIAVFLGSFAVVANLLALPILFRKIDEMKARFCLEMDLFKMNSEETWNEMIDVKRVHLARYARYIPVSEGEFGAGVQFPFEYNGASEEFSNADRTGTLRDNGANSTMSKDAISYPYDPDNPCPAGSPGPPGTNGQDGVPGKHGEEGLPGLSAYEVKLFDEEMCLRCPHGPQGLPGAVGPLGLQGKKGLKGGVGKKGFNGENGKPGLRGLRGQPGISGKPGGKGFGGKPAPGGKGFKGPKGAKGPIGRSGPQGESGKPSFSNFGIGFQGVAGKSGDNGTAGKIGLKGQQGAIGFIGSEGGYCPCPKELRKSGPPSGSASLLGTTVSSINNAASVDNQFGNLGVGGQAPSVQAPGSRSIGGYNSPGLSQPEQYANYEPYGPLQQNSFVANPLPNKKK